MVGDSSEDSNDWTVWMAHLWSSMAGEDSGHYDIIPLH